MLYSISPRMPEKYRVRYAVDSGITLGGVFMKFSMKGVIQMPTKVKITPMTKVIRMEVCTVSLTLSYFLAP